MPLEDEIQTRGWLTAPQLEALADQCVSARDVGAIIKVPDDQLAALIAEIVSHRLRAHELESRLELAS